MYRFIQNIGDFFTPGYYTEDFVSKVIQLSGYDNDAIKELSSRFPRLKAEYFDFKTKVKDRRLHNKYIIKETHDFNTKIMEKLGYDTSPAYANWLYIDDNSVIPARSILYNGSQVRLVVLEMQASSTMTLGIWSRSRNTSTPSGQGSSAKKCPKVAASIRLRSMTA